LTADATARARRTRRLNHKHMARKWGYIFTPL
jgi:hypothetical protein